MRTSEIPPYTTGDIESVITLVEIEPDVRRLRLTPKENFQGEPGVMGLPGIGGGDGAPGTNGTDGTNGTNGTNGAPGTPGTNGTNGTNGINGVNAAWQYGAAASDETTVLTTGTTKLTFRMPSNITLTGVRASLTTVSSSGLVTVDINQGGSTLLSTKITIDVGEKTSTTAATPPVISTSALTDDSEITVDIDVAGTGATGLKILLLGTFV